MIGFLCDTLDRAAALAMDVLFGREDYEPSGASLTILSTDD